MVREEDEGREKEREGQFNEEEEDERMMEEEGKFNVKNKENNDKRNWEEWYRQSDQFSLIQTRRLYNSILMEVRKKNDAEDEFSTSSLISPVSALNYNKSTKILKSKF